MPTVLIPGASRGLGLEFARQYANDRWQVIATCRDPEKAEALQKLAQQYSSVQIEKLDVADQASIAALADKLKDTAIDILINNAGILSGSSSPPEFSDKNDASQNIGSIDPKAWAKILEVNTIAPVMVSQAFLPHIRRGSERKIVMISSGWASIELTSPGYMAYRTSKTALNAAMRNVALTLAEEKIIVVSLGPGWVKTDMGGENADISPEASARGLRKVIAALTLEQSGQFLRYTGNIVPW